METIAQRWNEMIPVIEKRIAESTDGKFSISKERLRRSYRISEDDWHEMLMINKQQEKFVVDYFRDWTFRLPRSQEVWI